MAGTADEEAWTDPSVLPLKGEPCGAAHRLTGRGRLDLGLGLLGISSCKDVWRRIFSPFNLALKGIQTLDVLLFQGAGSTA